MLFVIKLLYYLFYQTQNIEYGSKFPLNGDDHSVEATSFEVTQENFKQTGKRKLGELNHGAQIPAALLMQDTKWTLPSAEVNFMLNDLKKKYGENTSLISWYFLKYTTGSFVREHMHNLFPTSWSTITMLSEPDEYTGGELVIHTRNNEEEIILEGMIEV